METRERDVRLPKHESDVAFQRVVLPAPNETLEGIHVDSRPLYAANNQLKIGEKARMTDGGTMTDWEQVPYCTTNFGHSERPPGVRRAC